MIKSNEEVYVIDTSVLVERAIVPQIKEGKLKGKIIIPLAVLGELEHLANTNQTEGFLGLEEIKEIKAIASEKKIVLEFVGEKPAELYIKGARAGAIDDLIRQVAVQKKATLVTADRVQALVAEAMGVKTILITPVKISVNLNIEDYFDESTMSIHLKENTLPIAKKGVPGKWALVNLAESPLTLHEIKLLAADVIEKTKRSENAFIELSEPGITIVQFKNYRIIITRPPLSDGWEITATRPLVSLELSDYKLSQKLLERLLHEAEGILISGSPGSGKTTFAAALAKEYLKLKKIVKTIESPRDLQVPDEITQYSKAFASKENIHNVLLLTRPDFTIFDEMRVTSDFELYADLRLAGIGLIGVVHATNPIDAVQRLISRVELGMLPSIVDTVIFIEGGVVTKVLELNIVVKVPTGMTEADLARPVVEVRDFETKELEFEIYTYGEQTIVVPIKKRIRTKISQALDYKMREAKNYFSFYFYKPHVHAVKLLLDGQPLTELSVPRSGEVKIHKKSHIGKQLSYALSEGKEVGFLEL
ncbi:MAG: ATPase, T2SS/T4P/T4SS family [Candidatus Nanoarchaeia archaeon]